MYEDLVLEEIENAAGEGGMEYVNNQRELKAIKMKKKAGVKDRKK